MAGEPPRSGGTRARESREGESEAVKVWKMWRVRLAVCVLAACLGAGSGAAQEAKARSVVLITADGLRWQEVFRGADPAFFGREETGMEGAGEVAERFGGASVEQRRAKLMPFFWNELVKIGALYGNRDKGSEVVVRNRHRFSYPGYSEILTGKPQDDVIDSNENRPNPSYTVLEIVRRELGLPREQVALFGSWEVFEGIGAHEPGSVVINAGFTPFEEPGLSPRLEELSRIQFRLLTPWRTVRHDYITFEFALEYLRTKKPRLLYIALGETDDWAHAKRYDRYLETAHYFDECVGRLWHAIQEMPEYRGRTLLIVATDHGRGPKLRDWHRHGADQKGAQYIWLAVAGPGLPAVGEARSGPRLTQSDIGPTILEWLGIPYTKLEGVAGRPLPLAAAPSRR